MVNLSSLPDDILKLVLQRLHSSSKNPRLAFKRNLCLLKICPRWRRLALPALCKNAFVIYDQMTKCNRGTYKSVKQAESGAENSSVCTNINLIKAAGCINSIRAIEMAVHYYQSPFEGLAEIIELLRISGQMTNARHLELTMHTSFLGSQAITEISEDHLAIITSIGDAINNIMPYITSLKFGGVNSNMIGAPLYGKIAEGYSSWLQSLTSSYSILVSNDCLFQKLENVHIDMVNHSDQFPSMDVESLKNIHVLNCSHDVLSPSIAVKNESNAVNFSNLETLNMHCNYSNAGHVPALSVSQNNRKPLLMKFPKLKTLCLYNTVQDCTVLRNVELPQLMESVEIQTCELEFKHIAKTMVLSANNIALSTGKTVDNNSQIVSYMNQILNKAEGCKNMSLHVNCELLEISTNDITCNQLTDIKISATTSVSVLLSLVERLPNVTCMELTQISLGDVDDAIGVTETHGQKTQYIAPIRTKLSEITLVFKGNGQGCFTDITRVVVYLMLRLTLLKRLTVPQVPKLYIRRGLKQFISLYPHTSDVCLITNE